MDYKTWSVERTKCEQCIHRIVSDDWKRNDDKKGTIWRCSLVPVGGRGFFQYCNYARDPEAACGPDAKLFQPKVTV